MTVPRSLEGFAFGEVLGCLRTAAQVPFLDATGETLTVPMWFVACADRCWLVGAAGEQRWWVASPDAWLDKGWTWDALVVGRWSAPLRTGTRKEAEALLARYAQATRNGEEEGPPVPPRPDSTTSVAAGAAVPRWVPPTVEAPSSARWLLALETGRSCPRVGRDGQIVHDPVWLLFSDEHQVMATERGWTRPFERLIHRPRIARRDLLLADGWVVPSTKRAALAVALGNAAPERRWALVAEDALLRGDRTAAGRLLGEAFVRGRHEACWAVAARLALAEGRAQEATQALRASLERGEALPASIGAWTLGPLSPEPVTPAGLFAELPPLSLPPGMPWPPERPEEVAALAAAVAGRREDAEALWSVDGWTPRALEARAAFAVWEQEPDGWRRSVEAATAWRSERPAHARRLMERALASAPPAERAALRWRLGAWCAADGLDPCPHWDDAIAVLPPVDLTQGPKAWAVAAELAERRASWEVAIYAWEQRSQLVVDDPEPSLRIARIAEETLDAPARALAALEEAERRLEAGDGPQLGSVRAEIARLAAAAGRPASARRALWRALRGAFLSEDVWERALALAPRLLDDEVRRWLEHVHAVLVGADTRGAIPLRKHLDASQLDALHPGGSGWLARVQRNISPASPPPRSDLVRGLERVEASAWPELAEASAQICEALGLSPPDLYLFRGEGAWGLAAWPTKPPLVLVGHDHLRPDHPRHLDPGALRFALAVELTHLAAKHPLLNVDGSLVGTSRSVYEAFGRYAGTAETVVDVVTLVPGIDQLTKIQTLIKLSRKVFTARTVVDKTLGGLELLGATGGEPSWRAVGRSFEGAALQFRLQADRAALLLTGDLRGAVEAILAGDADAADALGKAREEGLLAVLPTLPPDARLRLASLVEFAVEAAMKEEDAS